MKNMKNDKISVILVNYNGKKYNDKCIASILASSISAQLQIVVVDNASTDDSLQELRQHWEMHEQVHIIAMEDNYGFSKANNEGIRWSIEQGIEYFLLLNNDTEIELCTIERMMDAYKKTKGIIVPKILYADEPDTIWCAGGEFSSVIKKPIQRGLNQINKDRLDDSGECEFANGCCLLLSSEVIGKIGVLDERFFLYYEDTEYSIRAKNKGVCIWYCASAIVYHKVNGSTRGNELATNAYYIARNWLLCNSVHFERSRFILFCIYFLFNRVIWILSWSVKGKWDMNRATILGVRDFQKKQWGKWSG